MALTKKSDESIATNGSESHQSETPDQEEIYSYHKEQLVSAITSSLPILLHKLTQDTSGKVHSILTSILHFLIPWMRDDFQWHSPSEILNIDIMKDNLHLNNLHMNMDNLNIHLNNIHLNNIHLKNLRNLEPISWSSLYQKLIIGMDFDYFMLLWKSCSGLLLLIAVTSLIPGKLHVWSGRIFRWPVLVFTYIAIFSELIAYCTVRLFIRFAETIFFNSQTSFLT